MWYFCDAKIFATSTQKIIWKLKKDMTNWTNVNMFLPISSLRNGHKKIKYFLFFPFLFSGKQNDSKSRPSFAWISWIGL